MVNENKIAQGDVNIVSYLTKKTTVLSMDFTAIRFNLFFLINIHNQNQYWDIRCYERIKEDDNGLQIVSQGIKK